MTQNNTADSNTSNNNTSSNKRQLLVLIVIAALATFVPYVMYLTGWGIPEATTNKGILVQEPIPVDVFHYTQLDGQPWVMTEQTPKFRLVFPVAGECDELCREQLYLTRQVHTRLNDKEAQLQRVYINLGEPLDTDFREYLTTEHPELLVLNGRRDEWQTLLSEREELANDLNGHEYYLLHRYSALSMAYNQQHTGNELLDDLKFLIKTTN